jgi:hypothetical protein
LECSERERNWKKKNEVMIDEEEMRWVFPIPIPIPYLFCAGGSESKKGEERGLFSTWQCIG